MEEKQRLISDTRDDCVTCSPCVPCCSADWVVTWRRKSEPWSAWLTLLAVFIINVLVMIYELSFGIIYEELEKKFDASKGTIGLVLVVSHATFSVAGLLASSFITFFGCRAVAVTCACFMAGGVAISCLAPTLVWFMSFYGVLAGTGAGGVYIASLSIIQQCFTTNRGLATGMSVLGFTVGTVLAPLLVDYLLQEYGLSGGVLLMGGALFQTVLFGALLKSPSKFIHTLEASVHRSEDVPLDSLVRSDTQDNEHNSGLVDKSKKTTVDQNNTNSAENSTVRQADKVTQMKSSHASANGDITHRIRAILLEMVDFSLLRNGPYLLCVLFKLFLQISTLGINTHTVSAAMDKEIPQSKAAFLMTIVGLCNLAMRLVTTVTLSFDCVGPAAYICFGAALLTCSGFVLATSSSYQLFVVAMVLMGSYEGITFAPLFLVIVQVIGANRYERSFAIFGMVILPCSFIGGPLAGWLNDKTGDYFVSFLVIGSCSAVATVIAVIIHIILLRNMQRGANT